MAIPLIERLGLNPRERRLALIAGGVLGALLFVGLPAGREWAGLSRQSDVSELRKALDAIQGARASIRERQSKKDSIASIRCARCR